MGQKVHPLGFRLGITEEHSSKWFATKKFYAQNVLEDHFLRKFLFENFPDAGIVFVEIQRKMYQIEVDIYAARPRILLNGTLKSLETVKPAIIEEIVKIRKGSSLNYPLSGRFSSKTGKEKPMISFNVFKVENPNASATFLATFLVEQLQKRVPFRKAMKTALQKAERAGVKGIKIQISGRLNGAEIARSEWIRSGRVPLQTLRAKFEYSTQTAKTIYGLLGIKVWIFQGLAEI
jgi:small subunit ribosomal protein S3